MQFVSQTGRVDPRVSARRLAGHLLPRALMRANEPESLVDQNRARRRFPGVGRDSAPASPWKCAHSISANILFSRSDTLARIARCAWPACGRHRRAISCSRRSSSGVKLRTAQRRGNLIGVHPSALAPAALGARRFRAGSKIRAIHRGPGEAPRGERQRNSPSARSLFEEVVIREYRLIARPSAQRRMEIGERPGRPESAGR